MQLNFRKTILDLIDEGVSKSPRTVESVTLTKAERAELYRVGTASGRMHKERRHDRPEFRGWLQIGSGLHSRYIEVLAA
jgi:hypothetical protein